MTELHLVLILVNTGKSIQGLDPSGRATVRQVQTQARHGTYCRYEQGVTIYEKEVTTACPQVFVDRQGRLHVWRDQ